MRQRNSFASLVWQMDVVLLVLLQFLHMFLEGLEPHPALFNSTRTCIGSAASFHISFAEIRRS